MSDSNFIAIGYSAAQGSFDGCIAIGAGASTAPSNNTIAIGASAFTGPVVRVGASVRLSYEGKTHTGEVAIVSDGYCYVDLDGPDEGEGMRVMLPVWAITEIDALQRFTEASTG